MFGFLRKKEKSSTYLLSFEQEYRLRKMEAEITRLKKSLKQLNCPVGKEQDSEDEGAPDSPYRQDKILKEGQN